MSQATIYSLSNIGMGGGNSSSAYDNNFPGERINLASLASTGDTFVYTGLGNTQTVAVTDTDTSTVSFTSRLNAIDELGNNRIDADVTLDGTVYTTNSTLRIQYQLDVSDGTNNYVFYGVTFGELNVGSNTIHGLMIGDRYNGVSSNSVSPPPTGTVLTVVSQRNSGLVNLLCFSRGTLIKTQAGEVLIEDLTVENLVQTMDCGYQPVRWIGSSKLDSIDLATNPKLRPVCITAGALGAGMPATDLRVSPQHRVLVRSVISERMFNTTEVLIPAIKLIELDGIYQDQEATEVEYFHMLFDRHEIVFSNGAATESLFTGPEALKAVSPEAREEISILFPKITAPDYTPTAARHIPEKGKLMKQLVARHAKNGKVMVQHIRPD